MDPNTRKQVVATLIQQDRKDLAEVVARGKLQKSDRALKKALKLCDAAYGNVLSARAEMEKVGGYDELREQMRLALRAIDKVNDWLKTYSE